MTEPSFPNPNSLDFTDLLEYDEFDVYNELPVQRRQCTDELCCNSNEKIDGVPLSIELSQVQDVTDTEQEHFVKASELFLRFDGGVGSTSTSTSDCVVDTSCGSGIKFSGSDNGSNSSETPINIDCVELQYENEFDDDDDDCGGNNDFLQFTEATKSYHSMNENENEQLLLEGILKKNNKFILAYYIV